MVYEIPVIRVSKCVTQNLYRYRCPKCNRICFSGHENIYCDSCGDLDAILDLNNARWKNLVAINDDQRRKTISVKIVRRLKIIQENKCAYCFKSFDETTDYHVDHILPLSAGGSNKIENLALACARCNLLASNKIFNTVYGKSQYIMSKIYPTRCTFSTL